MIYLKFGHKKWVKLGEPYVTSDKDLMKFKKICAIFKIHPPTRTAL